MRGRVSWSFWLYQTAGLLVSTAAFLAYPLLLAFSSSSCPYSIGGLFVPYALPDPLVFWAAGIIPYLFRLEIYAWFDRISLDGLPIGDILGL